MSSLYHSVECPFCGDNIGIRVRDKGPTQCMGGTIIDDRYFIEPEVAAIVKTLDVICKGCGSKLIINAKTSEESNYKPMTIAPKKEMMRAMCGSLTIKHLGGGNPGIINFSMLYPVPPQSDNQGNIPLPAGGQIAVFNACVGDIYIFRQIDPPIQVINESQTGYFQVSRKLYNESGFSKTASIWGKAVVAQHPHLQNSITYDISHPDDRIHLTYHVFSKYLLDKGHLTVEDSVNMSAEEQYGLLMDVLKDVGE